VGGAPAVPDREKKTLMGDPQWGETDRENPFRKGREKNGGGRDGRVAKKRPREKSLRGEGQEKKEKSKGCKRSKKLLRRREATFEKTSSGGEDSGKKRSHILREGDQDLEGVGPGVRLYGFREKGERK